MAATYTSPDSSNKDAVRFLTGDTDVDNALLQDGEIDYIITHWTDTQSTVEYYASVAADTIAAKFAREANFSADGVSVGLGNVAMQYRDLAANLREQHKNLLVGGSPDVGGITPGEQTDPDIAPFIFGTDMHDNPEAGRQNYGSRSVTEFIPENNPGV